MSPPANREASAARSRIPETITSRDNRWLKRFRAALAGDAPSVPLASGSADDREGETAGVEGARLVETALKIAASGNGLQIVALLISDAGARHMSGLAPLVPPSARLLHASDPLFEQIADTKTPQGIAALVRVRTVTFDDLTAGVPLILVLAGVQDPGNVGALIRSADAFGATGAAACAAGGIGTANPFAPKALRASAGAALRLPILRGAAAPVLMAQLRVAGVRVVAACPQRAGAGVTSSAAPQAPREPSGRTAAISPDPRGRQAAVSVEPRGREPSAPWEIDWRGATALLVGNEGAGLPPELARSADETVRIPQTRHGEQAGFVDSLNAAAAGAVLLYEAARQRGLG